jgi:hypothetical protein
MMRIDDTLCPRTVEEFEVVQGREMNGRLVTKQQIDLDNASLSRPSKNKGSVVVRL